MEANFQKYRLQVMIHFTPSMGLTLGLRAEHHFFDLKTDVRLKYYGFFNDRVGLKASDTRSQTQANLRENTGILG